MKQKQLCIIKRKGKQAMWSCLLSIRQFSFKDHGEGKGFEPHFNPIRSRGGEGVFRDSLSFLAMTLRALDRIFETWWLFLNFYMKSGEIKMFSKLATMHGSVIWE